MDTKRQNRISRLVQKEINTYFQQKGSSEYLGSLISATIVRVTPDLSLARIYLSIFPPEKQQEVFQLIQVNKPKIKYEIGKILGKQLRKVPEFEFFIDDSLDYIEKIDNLLKE